MKRKILIGVGILALLLLAAAGLLWWWMGQPMYSPGDVRAQRNLRAPLDPPAQSGAPGTWQVERDVTLKYFSSGSGRNVLVIHGGPGLPVSRPYQGLEPLSDRWRFLYYDQRGCGGSTRPIDRLDAREYRGSLLKAEQTLGIGAHLADIERIRRILGDERLILIGHSWGGFLAALYAAEFPERIQALILIAPADMLLMPSPHGDLFVRIRRRLPESERAAFDEWLKGYLDFGGVFARSERELAQQQLGIARFFDLTAGSAAAGIEIPGVEQAGGWMVKAQFFSLGRRHDYRAALRQVASPALVLHGSQDILPEASSRSYVEALPHARLAVIEGAGHFPQITAPAPFAARVAEFLNGIQSP